MNEGRTVFAQLLDFLPKYEFDKWACFDKVDREVESFG